MKFEDGRIGMEVIKGDEKGIIATLDAEDRLFFIQFPDRATWAIPGLCNPAEYTDPLKFHPGEKGWVPDQLAEGIDIMNITEELVAVEVGK